MSTTQVITNRGHGDPRRDSRRKRKQERLFARRHHADTVQRIAAVTGACHARGVASAEAVTDEDYGVTWCRVCGTELRNLADILRGE